MNEDAEKEIAGANHGQVSSSASSAESSALPCPGNRDRLFSPPPMQSSTSGPARVGGDLMKPNEFIATDVVKSPGAVIRVGINELLKKHPASVKSSSCKRSLSSALSDSSYPVDNAEETDLSLTNSTSNVCPMTDDPKSYCPPSNVCGPPSTTLSHPLNKCIPQEEVLSSTFQSTATSTSDSFPVSSKNKPSATATISDVNTVDGIAGVVDHDASTQDALLLLSLSTSLYEDAPETTPVEDVDEQKTVDGDKKDVAARSVGTTPAASVEGDDGPVAVAGHQGGIVPADVTSISTASEDSPAAVGQDMPGSGKDHIHASVADAPCLTVPSNAKDKHTAGGNLSTLAPLQCVPGHVTILSASPDGIGVSNADAVLPIADKTRPAQPIDVRESAVAANLDTDAPLVSSTGHDASNWTANTATGVPVVAMATNDQEKVKRDAVASVASQSKSNDSAPIHNVTKSNDVAPTTNQSKRCDDMATDDQNKRCDDTATDDQSKQCDDVATDDQNKQCDEAATDQSKRCDDAATDDQSKRCDDQSKHCDDTATDDQKKYCDDSTTDDQSKHCDDAGTENQSKHCNDAVTDDQNKHCDDAATDDQSKCCDDSTTHDHSKHCDDAATEDQSKLCDDAATDDQSKHCDDATTDDQSKHCNDATTDDQSKHCDDAATDDQSKHCDDASTDDQSKHSDEMLENVAIKSKNVSPASAENKPCNDLPSSTETELNDAVPSSNERCEELADREHCKVAEQCNYLPMIEYDDEFDDDVTLTEQDEKMLLGESTPKNKRLLDSSSNTDDANNSSDVLGIFNLSNVETSAHTSENEDPVNVLGVGNSVLDLKCSEANASKTAKQQSCISTVQSVSLDQATSTTSDQYLNSKGRIIPLISVGSKGSVIPHAIDVALINTTPQITKQNASQAPEIVSVGCKSIDVEGNVTVDNSDQLNKQEPLEEAQSSRSGFNLLADGVDLETVESKLGQESAASNVSDQLNKQEPLEEAQSSRSGFNLLADGVDLETVESKLGQESAASNVSDQLNKQEPLEEAQSSRSGFNLLADGVDLETVESKLGQESTASNVSDQLNKQEPLEEAQSSRSGFNLLADGVDLETVESKLGQESTASNVSDNGKTVCSNENVTETPFNIRTENCTGTAQCQSSDIVTAMKENTNVSPLRPSSDDYSDDVVKLVDLPPAKAKVVESVIPLTIEIKKPHVAKVKKRLENKLLQLGGEYADRSVTGESCVTGTEANSANSAPLPDEGMASCQTTAAWIPREIKLELDVDHDAVSGMNLPPESRGSSMTGSDPLSGTGMDSKQTDDVSVSPKQDIVGSFNSKELEQSGTKSRIESVLSEALSEPGNLSCQSTASVNCPPLATLIGNDVAVPNQSETVSEKVFEPESRPVSSAATRDDRDRCLDTKSQTLLINSRTSTILQSPQLISTPSDDPSSCDPKSLMKSATSDISLPDPKTPPVKSSTFDDASLLESKIPPMKSATSDDTSSHATKNQSVKCAASDNVNLLEAKTLPVKSATSDGVSFLDPKASSMKSDNSDDTSFAGTKAVKSNTLDGANLIEIGSLHLNTAPAENNVLASCSKSSPPLRVLPAAQKRANSSKESIQTSDSEDDLLTIDENASHVDTAEIDDDFLNNLAIKTNASFLPGLSTPVVKSSQKKKDAPSSVTTSKPSEKSKVSSEGKNSGESGNKDLLDHKSKSDAKSVDENKIKSMNSKKDDSKTNRDQMDPLENLKRALSEGPNILSKSVSNDRASSSKSGSVERNEQPAKESLNVSDKSGRKLLKRSLDEKLASVKESVKRDLESKKRSTSTDKNEVKLNRSKESSSQNVSGKDLLKNVSTKKDSQVDKSSSSSSKEKHGSKSSFRSHDVDRKDSSVSRDSGNLTKKSERSYLSDKSKKTDSGKVKLQSSDGKDKSLRDEGLKHDEKNTKHLRDDKQGSGIKSSSKQSTCKPLSRKVRTPSGNSGNKVLREDSVKLGNESKDKGTVASNVTKNTKPRGMETAEQKEASVVKPKVRSADTRNSKTDDSKKEDQGYNDVGPPSKKVRKEQSLVSRQSQGDKSTKSVPVVLDDNSSKTRKSDQTADALKVLGTDTKRVLKSESKSEKVPVKKGRNQESSKVRTKSVESIAPVVSNTKPVSEVNQSLDPQPSRKKDGSPALKKSQTSRKQTPSPELMNTRPSRSQTDSPDIQASQEKTTQSASPEPAKKEPKKIPLIVSDPCSDLVITSVIGSVNLNDCSNTGASSRPSSATSTSSAGDCNQPGDSSALKASVPSSTSGKRVEVEELTCHWCRDVWNHYILHSLFRSACAVTVKSRITFGAIFLMYHWATNEKLPNKNEAIYNLLDRADLSKNLQGKNISMLVDWIKLRLRSKEQKCCDVFSLVYLTNSSISEKLKGFPRDDSLGCTTPSSRQRGPSVVKADLAKSSEVTTSPPTGGLTPSVKLPFAAAIKAVHAELRALVTNVATSEKVTPAKSSEIDCSDVVIIGTKRHQIDDANGTMKKVKLNLPGEKCVATINTYATKANSFLNRLSSQPGSVVTCTTLNQKILTTHQEKQRKLLVPNRMGCRSANSLVLKGAPCVANLKKAFFAEYNSMSVDVKEVFSNMPFERHTLEYSPDLKRSIRFTTVREVIALHNICVVPTHVDSVDEVRLLYRSTVQLLAARGLVLLLPDGPSLVKLTERLRKHYHRSQQVIETDLFLESRWVNEVAFTKMKDWKKIPQDEMSLSAVLALFCLWKNWDHLPSVQKNFSHVPQCMSTDGHSSDVTKSKNASKTADLGQKQGMQTDAQTTTPCETESAIQCDQSTRTIPSGEPTDRSKKSSQSDSSHTSAPITVDVSEKKSEKSSQSTDCSLPTEAANNSSATHPKPRPPLREFLMVHNVDVAHHPTILKDCLRLYDKFTYYAYVVNDFTKAQQMLSRPWLAQVRLQQIESLLRGRSANEEKASVNVSAQTLAVGKDSISDDVVAMDTGEATAPHLAEAGNDSENTVPNTTNPPINGATDSEAVDVCKNSKSPVGDTKRVNKQQIAPEKTRQGSLPDITVTKKNPVCESEFKDGSLLPRNNGLVALGEWVSFKQNSLLHNIMEMTSKKRPLPSKETDQESIASKNPRLSKSPVSADQKTALSRNTAGEGAQDCGDCVLEGTVTSNPTSLTGREPPAETRTPTKDGKNGASNKADSEPAIVDDEDDIPDHFKTIVQHLLQMSETNKSMIPCIIRNSFQLLGRKDVRLPNNEIISKYVNSIAT